MIVFREDFSRRKENCMKNRQERWNVAEKSHVMKMIPKSFVKCSQFM
ncbi:hypothetical protein ABH13_1961 [Bacillus velezensis]|nr:hypothetical protein U471_19770 [Bacillus amyloliquefaciens CC178]AHZ15974.1 hypothetical protein V529_19480 [Bacillus velezensis SQR9]AKL76545.1 hypothetical protein ABH13_1961 [Bacillus velezensis]AMQ71241.1 hypothetical protein BAMY6639_01165 [Bacillus amyloliquefaciens UMAF6639]EIF13502.1 hypothetical protein MY7_1833 [Bacillus sp. 5B6]EJD68817.1 hypothetical protein BB65665_04492 [Bacillus sp. 916]QEY91557.1 hypothetical protein BACIT_3779 [Bacillus amyloliquefaciens]